MRLINFQKAQPETIIEAIRVTNANIERGRYDGQPMPKRLTESPGYPLKWVVKHEEEILTELRLALGLT